MDFSRLGKTDTLISAVVAAAVGAGTIFVGYRATEQEREKSRSELTATITRNEERVGQLREKFAELSAKLSKTDESLRRSTAGPSDGEVRAMISKELVKRLSGPNSISEIKKQLAATESELQNLSRKLTALSAQPDGRPKQNIENMQKQIVAFTRQLAALENKVETIEVRPVSATADKVAAAMLKISPEKFSRQSQSPRLSASDMEKIVAEVVKRISRNKGSQGVSANPKIFGSGDCFEYSPLMGVRKATLAFGAAICVASIPEIAIRHTNGCRVSFAGRGQNSKYSSGDSVTAGETYTFSANGAKISLVLGCQRKGGRYTYPIRIYAQ